jgi:hypothetical protein
MLWFIIPLTLLHEPTDGAVRMATGYGLDGQGVGVRVPVSGRFFLLSMSSRPARGPTQPLMQWEAEALSPGANRQGSEADH